MMRTRDVAVGGTYLVEVSYELPPGRYLVDAGSAESIESTSPSGWPTTFRPHGAMRSWPSH